MSLSDALAFPPRPPPRAITPPIDPDLNNDFEDADMQGDAEGEEEEEEEEEAAEPKEEEEDDEKGMRDLFGDDAVFRGDTPPPGEDGMEDGLTSPERRQRKALEYEEDDQEEPQEEPPLRDASVQIPNIPVPKSSDGDYWVIRMPNFVKIDSKPFHPETYVGPEHEDDDGSQQHADAIKERSLSIKLEVENTVRWRWIKDEEGNDRKQSNSRFIRWSDGSLSLRLGNELFDVNHNIDTSGSVSRSALGGSQSQSQSQSTLSQSLAQSLSQSQAATQSQQSNVRSQGLTYLVAQHKRAEVLQAEKLITGHLTLRPTSMQAETHRKLVRAVGQKHNKVARLRMAPTDLVQKDPDKELAEMAKNAAKKPRKSGKRTDDGLPPVRRKRGGSRKARDQGWSDDDEGEPFAGSDDSEDIGRRKVRKKSAGDEPKGGDYQTTDGFVVSDEDDDLEDIPKKGRKRVADDDDEKDALEQAEDKLEEESKKRRKGKGGSVTVKEEESEDSDRMEVESEEDDDDDQEEVGIRKPTTGGRRKHVAMNEDEDEE
ncbi:RNA polymerase II-associated protein [Hysterangium stoloniferum]|nr:RNA polymerase II-associated protein [Hysterangium stoloniferum]